MQTRRRCTRLLVMTALLLAGVSSILFPSGRAQAGSPIPDWVPAGRPAFSGAQAYYTSIALDAQNVPYVAFMDFSNGHRATVMKHPGSGPDWQLVGAPGFSTGQVRGTQIALDGSGTPYVAYIDYARQYKATVMKFNGSAWVAVGTAGFSAGEVESISLALDGSGTPYVAYLDDTVASAAVVMKFDGVNWVAVGAPGFTPPAGYLSLALNPQGVPYVAFDDSNNGSKTTVMKYSAGSGWQLVGAAAFSAGRAEYVSLEINSQGVPYVAYLDAANQNQASVMRYDTGAAAWQRVGTTSFGVGPVYFVGLAISPAGTPFVAFKDGGLAGRATVMKFDGSSWLPIGATGFTLGAADYTSMVLDSDSNPYVAFADWHSAAKASVMRYSLEGKVMPVVTMSANPAYHPAANGWYNLASSGANGILVDVTAYSPYGITSITCTDNGLNVLDTGQDSGTMVLGDGDHRVTCLAGDGAGSHGAGTGSTAMPAPYPVDQTRPTLNPVVSPNPVPLNGSATASAGASDSVSGIATQSCAAVDAGSVGSKSVACSATDKAGNSASASAAYEVKVVDQPPPPPSGKKYLYLPSLKRGAY